MTGKSHSARTNPKTIKERIKSLTRRHIHIDGDWRTPVKLKKAGEDPIISALQHHAPRTYHFGKAHASPKRIIPAFSAAAKRRILLIKH